MRHPASCIEPKTILESEVTSSFYSCVILIITIAIISSFEFFSDLFVKIQGYLFIKSIEPLKPISVTFHTLLESLVNFVEI